MFVKLNTKIYLSLGDFIMKEFRQIRQSTFWLKILSAVAMAIVVGVTPSAIVSPLSSFLAKGSGLWTSINMATGMCQFAVPVAAGVLAAAQFNFTMVERASVGLAAFISSGAAVYKNGQWILMGMGDLINVILITAVAIFAIYLVREHVGSFALIVDSILCGSIVGAFGSWTYTYVHMLSTGIGSIVNSFTTLQPIVMTLLLGMVFALLICTPISAIAIAYTIGLSGLAGGTPSVGITACFMFVAIATYKSNGVGLSIAMFFGSVKMMMANFVKHPRMLVPIAIVGALGGLTNSLFFKFTSIPQFAGFGQPAAPIQVYSTLQGSASMKLLLLALAYYILPLVYGLIAFYIFKKYLPKLFNEDDWKVDLSK